MNAANLQFFPVLSPSGLYGSPRLSGLVLCEKHAPAGYAGLETKAIECDRCKATEDQTTNNKEQK